MSAPVRWFPGCNAAEMALIEIIGAQSALNMIPEKLPAPERDAHYLADTDKWARHAYEHLNVAADLLISAQHVKSGTADSLCQCSAHVYLRM